MQINKAHTQHFLPDEHIYRPRMINPLTATTIFFLVVVGWQVGSQAYYMIVFHRSPYPGISIDYTIGFLIFGLLCWLILLGLPLIFFTKIRLSTSPQGIIFYGPGYSIYTPWSNLIGHGKMDRRSMLINPLLLRNVEGLRFEPPTTPMSLAQAIEQHQPAIEETGRHTGLYRFARVDMIPVGYFLRDWQHSSLAQEIHHHAPQVFAALS